MRWKKVIHTDFSFLWTFWWINQRKAQRHHIAGPDKLGQADPRWDVRDFLWCHLQSTWNILINSLQNTENHLLLHVSMRWRQASRLTMIIWGGNVFSNCFLLIILLQLRVRKVGCSEDHNAVEVCLDFLDS